MSQYKEKIAQYFEAHKEAMLKSLAEIVAIDSSHSERLGSSACLGAGLCERKRL